MDAVTESAEDPYDVIVVGGGLAGLAAAWDLRTRRVLVLEADGRVGGRLYSMPRDPYWLNLGAGVFSSTPSPVRALVDEMGLHTREIPGSTSAVALGGRIVKSGPIETYPFRLPIPLAARASLIGAGIKLRRAVREYHRLGRVSGSESPAEADDRVAAFRSDLTFAEFLGRIHPDVDALMRATAANRIGAELETISANGAIGSFAYQWSGKRSLLNHNLVGGSSRLPETMAERLGGRVRTSARVTRVRPDQKGVTVSYVHDREERSVRTRAVVVATPADIARDIIDGLPSNVHRALGEIRYGPAVLASILTRETGPMPYDDIYAMITPKASSTVFINVASSVRDSKGRRPGGSVLMYSGGDAARSLLTADDARIETELTGAFSSIFPQAEPYIDEVVVQRWERIVPFAHPGRHLLKTDLDTNLVRVALAGDYLGSWGNMEAAVSSGQEAARRVAAVVEGDPPALAARTSS